LTSRISRFLYYKAFDAKKQHVLKISQNFLRQKRFFLLPRLLILRSEANEFLPLSFASPRRAKVASTPKYERKNVFFREETAKFSQR